MGRSGVENGTHRTRLSPGPIRTDISRTWISILNSTLGTLPTIGPFSTHPRNLTFRLILTPSVFLSQKSSLISKHALPQAGVRTSLELLETTRWFSRRSTFQLSAMTSVRPPSGPPDSVRDSSWMDGELSRLNQEVADMQNTGSLTGRKKAAALAKGLKAQETLNKYSQCNVFWQPIDAAPLTTGGNGYVDGGDLDISGFERKGANVAQPSDSSAVKLTQGSSY